MVCISNVKIGLNFNMPLPLNCIRLLFMCKEPCGHLLLFFVSSSSFYISGLVFTMLFVLFA